MRAYSEKQKQSKRLIRHYKLIESDDSGENEEPCHLGILLDSLHNNKLFCFSLF